MDKKATGWIPDYPDFRDYGIDEINQKLMTNIQDIQINNDNYSQNGLEELFELLNSLKNSLVNLDSTDIDISKFEKFEQKISKGFKLVNAKALKEQIFLAPGCAGQEVYNFQQKLLKFSDLCEKSVTLKNKIKEFTEKILQSEYMEYGYFGKNTEKAVKLLKSIFELSIVSDEGVDSVVDQVTLYTLNQVVEILETEKTSENEGTEKAIKKLGMLDTEIKEIQIKLNKLGYLKNLGENNGAIKGLFDYLTQDAVEEFQRQYFSQNDLKFDGVYGIVCELTKTNLNKLFDKYNQAYNEQQQKAEDNKKVQEIKKIQKLLHELGEFDGQVTGNWGSQTQTAVNSFQARYRLAVDSLDDLQKLEKTSKVLDDLVALKTQQRREVLPVPSAIPINLYEIILRVFEISEFKAEDFVGKKGLQLTTDTDTFDIPSHQNVLKRSIDMIVKLVAQLISPLAQHRNLEKAVKDVLDKLDKWFNQSEYVNEIRKNNQLENQQASTKTFPNQLRYTQTFSTKVSSSENVLHQIVNHYEAGNNEFIKQKWQEKGRIFSQQEPEINLFKDWDLNPVSSYIALSTILNFKQSLENIYQTTPAEPNNDDNKNKKLATSLEKIKDIFKSIKDLKGTIEILGVSLSYNPQPSDNNHSKNQQNNLRTVIQILPEFPDQLKYLEKSPEFQSDLVILVEGNLQESIRKKQENDNKGNSKEKQENAKKVTVYLLMPEFVDLSFWCSPIEDQGSLDSCTAHAGVALMEYFEKRSFNRYIDASRLFLYKATRNLMHRQGDVGASLRQTMQAMALFGVPPEEYWPYIEDKFDEEPTPFCYSFGQSYQALKYFRLNPSGTTEYILLLRIKTALAAGFPCAFGFTMYYSIEDLNPSGYIPYPVKNDKVKGGHAVVAVGYDDHKVIENADGSRRSQGALLIRNSWGTDWGQGGYGWLPYDYVLEGLTNDWWSLLKSKWFETGHFGLGANDWASNLGGGDTNNIIGDSPKPPKIHIP